MSNTPRNLPRFLPMLTEVVPPPGVASTPALAAPDLEEIVQSVMQRVSLEIERRVREEVDTLVRTLVTDQLHTVNERLLQELEVVVRQAVADAMALQSDIEKK